MRIFDIETDGIDNVTKVHCLVYYCYKDKEYGVLTKYDDIRNFFLDNTKKIGHNIIRYDLRVLQSILNIKTKCALVDTLGLSWYLYPNQKKHGLEHYGDIYNIPKVNITDWTNLSTEDYIQRCRRDVEINKKLWEDQYNYLKAIYDTENGIWKLVEYVNHKMHCAMLAEKSKWKFNEKKAWQLLNHLKLSFLEKQKALEEILPEVPIKKTVRRPKIMNKKDGTLTAAGERWYKISDDSVDEVKIFSHFEKPNPNSTDQVKNWLYSLGWKPTTFKYNKKNKPIPQISSLEDKGEVCESVKDLIEKEQSVSILEGYSVLKHRIPFVENLINASKDGYIKAEVTGFTNTMRFIHKTVVNVPGVDKPYGKEIRSLFEARDGHELCGSDMSSLEDRTKQHFMFPYDPKYVKEMDKPDFDPHIDIAVLANMMTKEDGEKYKQGDTTLKQVRYKAKTTNYSCTYGAFPPRIARDANIPLEEAKELFDTYWKRNWSILEVVKGLVTKEINKQTWLFNPVSRLWYFLKHEKDKFSTLNQGTGAYCFDLWLWFMIQDRPQLTAQFHDEVILEVKEGYREETTKWLYNKIKNVNEHLKLNKEMDIDVQFGNNYSEIH